ncbi:MAG: hypothetical protein ABI175_27615 [Polyangiales bacterium]
MLRRALFVTLALVGCSDDANKDASVDIDNGSCGDQVRFTGEYVDWDTHTAFCGIKDATLDVVGGATDTTAPNGRFDLCLPGANVNTTLTITPPTAASQCTSPASTYTTPTTIYASKAVIKGGGFYSARSITMARLPAFFTQIGQTYDPAKAIVVVHVNGATPRAVSLSGTHGAPQVVIGAAWVAGDTGTDVVFPNVDAATGKAKLSVTGGGLGEGDVPVTAGAITNVAVIAN